MTIDKAIEILRCFLRGDEPDDSPDLPASIRLGVEALERLKEHREEHIDITFRALPGETTD